MLFTAETRRTRKSYRGFLVGLTNSFTLHMSKRNFQIATCALVFFALVCAPRRCVAEDNAIRVAGATVELTVDSVGERTVCIGVSPLDGEGQPIASPTSAVLVPYETAERLRARELVGTRR